jgi:hypothetical protein
MHFAASPATDDWLMPADGTLPGVKPGKAGLLIERKRA